MLADAALICMALNLYHEGRGEPRLGQVGIVHVTRNRAKGKPENVCKIVYARAQFSWTLKNPRVTDLVAFERCLNTALIAWEFTDITGGSDHYHHRSIRPYWTAKMRFTMQLGTHLYYRSTK
jgi:spore germination cell wall hydrolase CwlJ-like protein